MRATRLRRAMLGGLALLSTLALAAPARADTVTDWDQIAAAALQSPATATPPGAGQGAPSIAHLAMVHAAVYDAVNAIDGGHEPYVSSPAAEPGTRRMPPLRPPLTTCSPTAGSASQPRAFPPSTPRTRPRSTRSSPGRRRPAGSPPARLPRSRCWRRARATAASAPSVHGGDAAGRMAADQRRQRPGCLAEGRQPVRAPAP